MEQRPVFDYSGHLSRLNEDIPLSDKLDYLRKIINQRFPFIHRIAIALYDPKSGNLKTFLQSNEDGAPLNHYEYPLVKSSSLMAILNTGRPRVVNDLSIFDKDNKEHSERIKAMGNQASFTLPMFLNGDFFGFVFYNSVEKHVFNDECLHYLELVGHLLSLAVINEVSNIRTLLSAIKTARDISYHRDYETGSHLDRMSRYARIIAMALSEKYQLDDEFVEYIFMFSPLHDIGKIGISDAILLKPGKLTETEYDEMKAHTQKGRVIIDNILENFGLESLTHIQLLRNFAEYHHEAVNGSGYPHGLKGNEIPIESRIVAVADIFDALTSRRPYKDAWTNAEAFAMLKKLAGDKLDEDCVNALLNNRTAVEEIQIRFKEDYYG